MPAHVLIAGGGIAGLASAQPVLWRVSAFKDTDELARSATSPVEIP